MNNEKSQFICPECGSTEAGVMAMVSTEFDEEAPWSGVLQRITCARCRFTIPAHLAERWNGMSIEQAQQEWRTVCRATAQDENEE